jgi:pimeloyl-ACP methyl ester carboxylesterase
MRLRITPLLTLLAGCGAEPDDSTPPSCPDPESIERSEGYFHAYFPGEARIGDEVVPSDRWLERQDGRLQVDWPHATMDGGVGETDGFATFTPILVPFSAPLDEGTIASDGFELFRYDRGQLEPLPFELRHHAEDQLIYLVPVGLLPEGAGIAVAVRAGIQSLEGAALERPAAMDCLLAGWDDADHEILGAGLTAAMAVLEAAGEDLDGIAWLNTFQTASPNARLKRLGAAHDAALDDGSLRATFPHVLAATDGSGQLSPEVKALLPSDVQPTSDYSQMETFVQGQLEVPDASWALDLDGTQQPGEGESLAFTLLIPPLEDGGEHPVLIFLHGIACCRELALSTSSRFNSQGYIIAAIDAREHYVRNAVTSEECYSDWYALSFFDFSALDNTAGRFALSASDTYAMTIALEAQLPGLLEQLAAEQGLAQAPELGTFHFMGHSLGGIIGTMTTAMLPPRFADSGSAFVDSAGGGGLMMIGFNSYWAGYLGEAMGEDKLQQYIEFETGIAFGDPASHAAQLTVNHLVQEGEHDETMPIVTTELLALAGGLPLLGPAAWEVPFLDVEPLPASSNLAGGRSGGLVQFAGANHNFLFNQADQAMEQARLFMETGVVYDAGALPE